MRCTEVRTAPLTPLPRSRRPSCEATHSSTPIRGFCSESAIAQTFCTAARPSRPLGRTIMIPIRITNTIASENVEET